MQLSTLTNGFDAVTAEVLAKLLSGQPADKLNIEQLSGEGHKIAETVLAVNGGDKIAAFERAIAERPDADELRRAVFAVDPGATIDKAASAEAENGFEFAAAVPAPELPQSAHLSDSLLRDAAEAGRWLNRFVEYAVQAAPMTPKAFHQVLGLMLIAAAVARRLYTHVSNMRIFPNLYALIIAPSTLYRKSTGVRIAQDVLQTAQLDPLLLATRMTPESFLQELSDRPPPDFKTWSDAEKEDWQEERRFCGQRLWLMDEAAGLFDGMELKYNADLMSILLDLYDCPAFRRISTITRGRHTIRNAYLTFCGLTTPAALQRHLLKAELWGNGLFPRMALITPEARPIWRFWAKADEPPPILANTLHRLAFEKLPLPDPEQDAPTDFKALPVTLGTGVWQQWERYAKALEHNLIISGAVEERLYPSYGRFATMTLKVAMLLAATDWADQGQRERPVIELPHWARAQEIVESWRMSLHRLLYMTTQASRGEALEAKITARLKAANTALSSRELAMALGMTDPHKRRKLDDQLVQMERDGLVDKTKRKGKRGPMTDAWMLKNEKNI